MKLLTIIFIFLISLSVVNAADVVVNDVPIKKLLLPGEVAEFEIEIKNFQNFQDDFKLFATDFNWRESKGTEVYTLAAGGSTKDNVKLSRISSLAPGKYSVNLRVYSINNPEVFVDHPVIIDVVDYMGLIDANLEINPQGLDPRKENLVRLNLKNKYKINLDLLNIQIKSTLFTREFIATLTEKESKSIDFGVKLEGIKEGDYDALIFIKMNDNILVNKTTPIKVSAYADIREIKEEESKFLINTLEITRINDGNTESKEIFTKLFSSFENTFTKSNPEPTKIEKIDNDYKYTWQFDLNPGESHTINIRTNYRTPLIIFLIILIVLALVYNILRTEISIKKKVLVLKSKEGNIAHLKVLLIIKCRASNIRNLRLFDNVAGVFETPTEFTTLKPASVKKGMAGHTLIWEIPEILKGEERVISYKVRSHAPLVSRVRIPRAVCRYRNAAGKISIAKSNSVNLFS